MKISKTYLFLIGLVMVGFLYRAYPQILLVPRWMPCEDDYQWAIVKEMLLNDGVTKQIGFQAFLEHRLIYALLQVLPIDPITFCQFFNPLVGGLTVIIVFLLVRKWLPTKKAFLCCILYAFSEVTFYRTAKFGTTEGLGIFFLLCTLYFYDKAKKHIIYSIPTVLFFFLSFQTHIIPFIFGVIICVVDTLLSGTKKMKIIISGLGLSGALLMFSPFSPSQRIIPFVNPLNILSKLDLSNITNLYSLTELIGWMPTFMGTFLILLISSILLLRRGIKAVIARQPTLIISILIIPTVVFVWSWVGYYGAISSPVRVLTYFIVPLSFIIINEIKMNKGFLTAFLAVVMIASSTQGIYSILWIGDCVTANEYKAMDELVELKIFRPTHLINHWFVDQPARNMMVAYSARKWIVAPDPKILKTDTDNATAAFYRKCATGQYSEFKFVYISERMEEMACFRDYEASEMFSGRDYLIHKPVVDILAGDKNWNLVYDNHGVKVYRPKYVKVE